MKEVWCKHCGEHKVPDELEITKEEAGLILDIMDSEWIRFIEAEEEKLMVKLREFLEGKK